MQRSSYVTREDVGAYIIRFEDNRIRELITWYKMMLQKVIDEIWENITWKYNFENYRKGKYAKVKVPVIPKSREFKRRLRDELEKRKPLRFSLG